VVPLVRIQSNIFTKPALKVEPAYGDYSIAMLNMAMLHCHL
jgi:hypothetical protein